MGDDKQSLREYDIVRVKQLMDEERAHTGTPGIIRPPRLSDQGVIVMAYDESNFAIECVAANGATVWLADFCADEIELVCRPPATPYSYSIGTYDVTNSQYVAFLNSNVPGGETADPLALYSIDMDNTTNGGISYNSGAASGSKYSVLGSNGQNPVNYVTFYDAIRFANWLNNGQVPGSTETGAYRLLGGTPTPSNGDTIARSAGATVFLPSENELYKAAYYNPNTSTYNLYPTGSSLVPNASGPTTTPNSANYKNAVGHLTPVGSYTGTTSPYGAFDMGGDVYQWDEAWVFFRRGTRGGSFASSSSNNLLSSSRGGGAIPLFDYSDVGFRLTMIPEPSSLVLAAFGFAGLIAWGWRRKRLGQL
jgi:formylglycine-generating enzyme required for sulfatase activity